MRLLIGYFFIILSIFPLAGQSQKQPNILFIMSDDHTSQAWGVYGGILKEVVKNENIRRLADEGALMKNMFVINSICVPSRASILTGQYSQLNGVYTLSDSLDPQIDHIGKRLSANGYSTAIIGKWHLKSTPAGFDYFNILPGQGVYNDPVFMQYDSTIDSVVTRQYKGFSTDIITDLSLKWLQGRDREKSFFLMTQYKATHEPFDYPDRLSNLYLDDSIPEPESLYDFGPATNGRSFTGQKLGILGDRWVNAGNQTDRLNTYPGLPFVYLNNGDSIKTRKQIYQKFIKDFLRSAATIDQNIGRILEYLDEEQLTENTVVIYVADQGYFLGEHGFFDKRMMYEEAIRMPFVIRYPQEISPGTQVEEILLNIDIPALFTDYAGISPIDGMQGRSFRLLTQGKKISDWRTQIYYRYWQHLEMRPAHFGIRDQRYKLIFFYGLPLGMRGTNQQKTTPAWEFYDLQKDPHELWNAYHNPDYQEIIQNMKNALKREREKTKETDQRYPKLIEVIDQYWD